MKFWLISDTQPKSHHNAGAGNGQWKGDKVGYPGVHAWVKKIYAKPELCELCKERKATDLHNKNSLYKRNIKDWIYLCRKCHMDIDGRNERLRQNGKARKLPDTTCHTCKISFHPLNRKAKFCSRNCFFTRRQVI